jgi:pimeloyl-ACP methyl ester carboxylesterase
VKATLVVDAPLAHWRWGEAATAVVMLHGVGGGRDAWSDATSGTGPAVAGAGLLAVAVDLPGYGDSPTLSPYTMAGLAEAVERLIAHVDARRTVLVGHSMGGMVAQEVVARRPELVHALVLSGTSPAFGRPGGDWQRRFLAERLAPLDAGQGMPALAPGLVRAMAAPGADPARVERCAALMAAVPEATYRAALHAIVGFDRRADLARIAVPVLCIAGEHDRNAAPAVVQRMAQAIAAAESVCLPGVGHLANMEAPSPFNAVLLDFLHRRLPPQ